MYDSAVLFRLVVLSSVLLMSAGVASVKGDIKELTAQSLITNSWFAPDRCEKAAGLIPGRKLVMTPPDKLFADWTIKQIEKWNKNHKPVSEEEAYQAYAQTKPSDQELTTDFPDHISPFGRVLKGNPDAFRKEAVLIRYCPFCGSGNMLLQWGPTNEYHAATICCKQDLYGRERDYPADYKLRPNSTAEFQHLDDTVKKVPAYTFTDKDGVEWQLFIDTIFAQRRWLNIGTQVTGYMRNFQETADPVNVHKIAVLLDKVADTYYGLPFSFNNELATGQNSNLLTRAEWEAIPRPVREGSWALGKAGVNHFPWNRRMPFMNRGWVFQSRECLWVEPFARVRHHPAFKYYSQKQFGDPEALDKKIMTRLMHDLGLLFNSFALASDYQDGAYTDLMLLGMLLQDRNLFNFAAGHQECVLYNHHYHDGMNGEGAANYMNMLGSYYNYMQSTNGWLELDPDFLKDNPFFGPASTELHKLHTVRGLELEFGDQHLFPFMPEIISCDEKVRPNETRPSMNWPGYGIGILRMGGHGHRQEVFMTYDRVSLHSANDKMGIQCWVDGIPVMRAGGYGSHSKPVFLDTNRPGIKALLAMPYPKQIFETKTDDNRPWVTSPMSQNTVVLNEPIGNDWYYKDSFGELVTFKGGEKPDELGANFQVLDVMDNYFFERFVGVKEAKIRRAILGITDPNGRPYAVDIFMVRGGQRHTLFQHAWADRIEANLPSVVATNSNFAEYLWGDKPSAAKAFVYKNYKNIRNIEALGQAPATWDLTWKTDYAAYAPRDPDGKPFERPLPDDVGRVRLRLIGVEQDNKTTLIHGSGPWIAWMRQNLPGGDRIDGYVEFRNAYDYLIQHRQDTANSKDQPLQSEYVHIMEGYREGEKSNIQRVTRLLPETKAESNEHLVALSLDLADGYNDTVIFQPSASNVKLQNGLTTDAAYVLLRCNSQGTVVEAQAVRGTYLKSGKFEAVFPGDMHGVIVDLVGDLTGTRQESALIVHPDSPWPIGKGLAGRQILIETTHALRPANIEAYTIEQVAELTNGLLRVDLANHAPFAMGWYSVALLDTNRPNVLKSDRELWHGINTPWWWGCKAWFPELKQTYTIKKMGTLTWSEDRLTMELTDNVNLKANGVKPGNWFVIYAIEPGLKVTVPGQFTWRKEEITKNRGLNDTRLYSFRADGAAAVYWPYESLVFKNLFRPGHEAWRRVEGGAWQKADHSCFSYDRKGLKALIDATLAGQTVSLLIDKPAELNLLDAGAPEIKKIAVDGKSLPIEPNVNLGLIQNAANLEVEFQDHDNAIDANSIAVVLDDKNIESNNNLVKIIIDKSNRKLVAIQVDLKKVLAGDPEDLPVNHTIRFAVDDMAVDHTNRQCSISFGKAAKISDNAVYLSDLPEVSANVHGGLRKDTDYYGKPLRMRGALYPKCLQTHVTGSGSSEVIYDLSKVVPQRTKLLAVIGVSDDSGGGGSVVFQVQVADKEASQAKWKTIYTSLILRGADKPIPVSLNISGARSLRLYCTDAGDGNNGDQAAWGNVRLE